MTDRLDKSQSHYLTKVMRVKENEGTFPTKPILSILDLAALSIT